MNLVQTTFKALCIVLLITGLPKAEAAILVSDNFATNLTDREPGDPLNGVAAQVGGMNWYAESGSQFASGGGVTAANGLTGGSVSLSSLSLIDYVTTTATLNPTGSEWGALVFGNGPIGASSIFSVSQLFVLLTPGGGYNFFADVTSNVLASGSGFEFDSNGFATISITYTYATNNASFSILGGGAPVGGSFNLTTQASGFTPDITSAGFVFQPAITANEPLISSFSVESVPEPTAMLLFLGAGSFLLLSKRRNARRVA